MSSQSRPRLAVLTLPHLFAQQRTRQIATEAARDGWTVRVFVAGGHQVTREVLGPVKVTHVPVRTAMARAERRRRRNGDAVQTPTDLKRWDAEFRSAQRQRSLTEAPATGLQRLARKGRRALDAQWHEYHRKRLAQKVRSAPDPDRALGDWRRDHAHLLDIDLAVGPFLERWAPDAMLVQHPALLPTAATVQERSGAGVPFLYDVTTAERSGSGRVLAALAQVEREFAGRAVGVTVPDAGLVAGVRKQLPQSRPKVLQPVGRRDGAVASAGTEGAATAGLRAEFEVPEEAELVLVTGEVDAVFGVVDLLRSMPEHPDRHLVISSPGDSYSNWLAREALAEFARIHPLQRPVAPTDLVGVDAVVSCGSPAPFAGLPDPVRMAVTARVPVVARSGPGTDAFLSTGPVGATYVESADVVTVLDTLLATPPSAEAWQAFDQVHRSPAGGLSTWWPRLTRTTLSPQPDLDPNPTLRGQGEPEAAAVAEEPDTAGQPASTGKGRPVREPDRTTEAGLLLYGENPWRPLGDTAVRLGMGVANFAGQLSALAQAVTEAESVVSAEVITGAGADNPFGYPTDVGLHFTTLHQVDVMTELVERIVPRYTHYLADAFLPAFANLNGDSIAADLPALAFHNIKVALLGHGHEIRDPDRHLAEHPASMFRDAPEGYTDTLRELARKNQATAAAVDLPQYVATPDLLLDLPKAMWLPLVVDLDSWASDHPVMERKRPVVLHAPSQRWTKGTDLFLDGLVDMDRRGVIELRLVEGMPWSTMQQMVKDADVVIDQVAIGAYGAFACEAMAAGRPVIVNLSDQVVEHLHSEAGFVPLVNTAPDGVIDTLGSLLDDRDAAREAGRGSLEFVTALHSGKLSAERLRPFLFS